MTIYYDLVLSDQFGNVSNYYNVSYGNPINIGDQINIGSGTAYHTVEGIRHEGYGSTSTIHAKQTSDQL